MTIKTKLWDAADHLGSPEAVAEYLTAALEEGDPKLVAAALGDIARSIGMTEIAKATNLSRESLYRALSEDGNPSFATVLAVSQAAGLTFTAHPTAR